MIVKIIIILTTVTSFQCKESSEQGKTFFLFGNNPRPSPINLARSSMITKQAFAPLVFSPAHSMKEKFHQDWNNNGLDITLDYTKAKPYINGGSLITTYEFEKLSFHWDNNAEEQNGTQNGSYHTVNGKYYAMELQAYYKIYSNSFIFGLYPRNVPHTTIISIFFEGDREDNPAIKTILENKENFSLDMLIPTLEEYATYKGSLVVSPFTENVKWIISLNPQNVSNEQLKAFKKMKIDEGRPIQPLYGRKVFYVIP